MRQRRVVVLVVLLTAARLTMLGIGKPAAGVANRAYVLSVGAVLLLALLSVIDRHTVPPEPTAFDDAVRPAPAPTQRPTRLAALEDLAAFGTDKAQGTHFHLRPYLRELIGDRLAGRGLDLDTSPEVPNLLGPATWDLVRPDRPAPPDGRARGLDEPTVLSLTDALERLP